MNKVERILSETNKQKKGKKETENVHLVLVVEHFPDAVVVDR